MRDLKGDELSYVYGAGAPARRHDGNKFHNKASSKKRNKTSRKMRNKTSHRKHSNKKRF